MNWIDIVLGLIRAVIFLWDIITFPFYQLIYRPWILRRNFGKNRSHVIRKTESELIYEPDETSFQIIDELEEKHCDSLDKVWNWTVEKYGDNPILGTRQVVTEEEEKQANGKTFKKLIMGDYNWLTYNEVSAKADHVGRGLRVLGMEPKEKIAIFADTKAEWFISAQACFKQGFPLVTLYTNLGEDAIAHGINQTSVSTVVTSYDLLPKFKNILGKTPSVQKIIFFEDQLKEANVTGYKNDVQIVPFQEVVSLGKDKGQKSEYDAQGCVPRDLAIIMYTSGSTGVPKGVMLSHRNLMATLSSIAKTLKLEPEGQETYLAYLPLAHVLELLSEMMMCLFGVRIGYSHPNTLTDKSTMIKAGTSGDATILKPTIMAAVPLVLDRIYKAIIDNIGKRGEFFKRFFEMCFNYRLAAIRNNDSTPILDLVLFRKMRALIGGRMKLMFSGGAPLSGETHDCIRVCMGVPVLQGYGLTETTASACIMDIDDLSTGRVGAPNQNVQLKLINWDEGNYKISDKPLPRGEVVLGGNFVAEGYYKMPEKTAEEFYEEYGRRWFKTGDIGEITEDGCLRIIDRKKDLVKLALGEYVSLGKVESVLKTCHLVENICIYGDPSKHYCVALVVPNRPAFDALTEVLGKSDSSFESLCEDKIIIGEVLRSLVAHGKKFKLEKFELPGAVTLCKELWAPDSGLVTAAFKLKRKPIQDFYQRDLDRMYESTRGI